MGALITSKDLTEIISKRTGVNKQSVRLVLDCMADVVTHSLMVNEPVRLNKLGTFYNSVYKEREIFDRFTGENRIVEEHYVPRFKTSSILKMRIRGTFDKFKYGDYEDDDSYEAD